jgi:hypothetical protein
MTKIRSLALLSAIAGLAFVAAPAQASTPLALDLGTAGDYSVVALGSGISLNSGPIAGNVLLGDGVNAAFSGGNNGSIGGKLYYDNTVTGTNTFGQLQNAPATQLVSTSVTNAALNSANTVGTNAAGMAATQTFGNISAATTITGNGGLNVIKVTNIQNAVLTFSGNANDYFLIDVSGTFQTNVGMNLSGINASQILWNFTGTSGNVFQTSGGDTVYGTFLATDGGSFQFSNLNLTGALINTKGNMAIVSGSEIPTFTPQAGVPEPATWALFLMGFGGLGASLRQRRRALAPVKA